MTSKKIALFGDPHLQFREDYDANFVIVTDDIVNNSLATMLIIDGDVVDTTAPIKDGSGNIIQAYPVDFDGAKTKLNNLSSAGLEPFIVDGNHEWYAKLVTASDADAIAQIKDFVRGDSSAETISYEKVIGNTVFLFWSAENFDYFAPTMPGYRVSFAELAFTWLESKLAEHQDKNIIVICHYAVAGTGIWMTDGLGVTGTGDSTTSWGFTDTQSQRIKDLLNLYSVDAWFNAHTHMNPKFPRVRNNTPAGWGGCTFIHLPSSSMDWNYDGGFGVPNHPYHWLQMELVDGNNSFLLKTRDSQTQAWLSDFYDITVNLTNIVSLSATSTTYRLGAYPGVFRTGASRLGYAKKFSPAYSILVKNTETPANITTLLGSMTPGEQKTVSVDLKNDGDCSVEYVLGEGETNILFSVNNVDFSNPLKVTLAADAESPLWIQYTAPTNKVGASVLVEIPVSMMVLVERG